MIDSYHQKLYEWNYDIPWNGIGGVAPTKHIHTRGLRCVGYKNCYPDNFKYLYYSTRKYGKTGGSTQRSKSSRNINSKIGSESTQQKGLPPVFLYSRSVFYCES